MAGIASEKVQNPIFNCSKDFLSMFLSVISYLIPVDAMWCLLTFVLLVYYSHLQVMKTFRVPNLINRLFLYLQFLFATQTSFILHTISISEFLYNATICFFFFLCFVLEFCSMNI